MDEKFFLNEGAVRVSNARFMVSGQTYAMSGITSVQLFTEFPSQTGPVLMFVVGGLVLLAALVSGFTAEAIKWFIFAIATLAIGVLWLRAKKPWYVVLLRSASGEVRALRDKNKDWISRVVQALNDAIVARG